MKLDFKILIVASRQFELATNTDTVNKVYRQLRVWNRWQMLSGHHDTITYTDMNRRFKEMRMRRLTDLLKADKESKK